MVKVKKHITRKDDTLDWQFPDEETWRQAQTRVSAPPRLAQTRPRGLIGRSTVLLLVVTIGSLYWLWDAAWVERQRSKSDLLHLIALENTPERTANNALFNQRISKETPEHWRQTRQDQDHRLALALSPSTATENVTVEDIAWHGEFAVVQVAVTGSTTTDAALAYRQTRFHQRRASGWVHIAPMATLWGPVQSMQTRNFTFLFREPDRPAVMTVAASIDQRYAVLRQDFGLPALEPAEPLTIEVTVTDEAGHGFTALRGKRVRVPSPALLPIATEFSAADVLAQHIVAALATHMAEATSAQGIDAWEWHNLVIAVYRWQLWQHNAALTAWHNQVTAWLYSTTPANARSWPIEVEEPLTALCRKAQILEASAPANVPALAPWCVKLDGLQQLLLRGKPARTLSELTVAPTLDWVGQGYGWPDWYHYRPLETLIDYAVITYGRDRLPVLLAALGDHHGWETLISAVFDVSADEFEQGWQAYLQAHYLLPNRAHIGASSSTPNDQSMNMCNWSYIAQRCQ